MGRFPEYPNFVPFSKDTKTEIMPLLQNLKDGISELTFYSLLIHTKKYNYRITQTKSGAVLLLRKKDEKNSAEAHFPSTNPLRSISKATA